MVQPYVPASCLTVEIMDANVYALLVTNEIKRQIYGKYQSERSEGSQDS